jgi:hypothetical protein
VILTFELPRGAGSQPASNWGQIDSLQENPTDINFRILERSRLAIG